MLATTALLALLATCAGLYLRGVDTLWRRAGVDRGVTRWRVAAYVGGLVTLALALASPLESLAHRSFAAHMVQHVLLMLVAPPLLVLGAPLLPLLWAVPRSARRRLARSGRPVQRLRRFGATLTDPLGSGLLATATLWVWHLPGAYQAALRHPALHVLEHGMLLASSCLVWWVVAGPRPAPRAPYGAALLLIFAMKVQTTTLGAVLIFAPAPLYETYAASLLPGPLTPESDQQWAGIVMGAPSALVYVLTAAGLFLRWLRVLEARAGGVPRSERAQ